ncbi:hypothetical protein bcgnr5369_36220 [Bacillus cereus]
MKLLKQPTNSYICGQTCVSMITGIPLSGVIKEIGHKNSTYTRELISAMKKFNIKCADKHIEVESNSTYILPNVAIIQIRNKRKGHYIIHNNGKFFDPYGKIYTSEEELFKTCEGYAIKYIIEVDIPGTILTDEEVKLINESVDKQVKHHVVECVNCGHKYKKQRKSKLITQIERYWCHKCGQKLGKLEYMGYM